MRAVNNHSTKPFTKADKRAAIELWRAKVPLKAIRSQLKMSESTLRRVLAFAKKQPENPIADRKPESGRPPKITTAIQIVMKRKLMQTPTLTANQLKQKIPELASVSVREILGQMSDNSYLQNLVESMPRRLQEVIDREGATTKY